MLSTWNELSANETDFWATVCKTVRPMLSDCCPVSLSVTLVYCCQTGGWIKMKLGMELGLGIVTGCSNGVFKQQKA